MSHFDLVDARFGIQPVLEQVAFLVKLLVNVGRFQEIVFNKRSCRRSLELLAEWVFLIEGRRPRILEGTLE